MDRKYYDLTSAQKILFYSQKFTIHKQVNNICTSVLMDSELDFDILKNAVRKAYERNDSFRIRIVKVGREVKQYFAEHEEPSIEYLDFRGKTLEEMEKKLYKIAHKPISVFEKPMSKVYLMHSFDGKSGIYFAVSHLIMDFWAITIFFKDVLEIYEALSSGKDMPKPLRPYEEVLISDLNYKNTDAYMKDRKFFEEVFGEKEPIFTHVNGSSVLEKYRLKKKKPDLRYAQVFSLRTKSENVMMPLPKELVEKMEAYCIDNKLSMQPTILLAFRSYLSKVNKGEKDITLYTIVARRGTLAEKNSGGSRAGFILFRTTFEEDDTFKKACEVIGEKQAAVYRHASIDSLEVMDILKNSFNVPEIGTYISSAVSYQPVRLVPPNGIKIETKWYGNGAIGNPLFLTVMDGDGTGAFKFHYEYQTHCITLETIQKLHSYMMKFLEAGIANGEITIGDLLKIE